MIGNDDDLLENSLDRFLGMDILAGVKGSRTPFADWGFSHCNVCNCTVYSLLLFQDWASRNFEMLFLTSHSHLDGLHGDC